MNEQTSALTPSADQTITFNPMAGNPFATRTDAIKALVDLSEPLMGHFSTGKGRLRLGSAGAHFHEAAADLEGLTRPLWGLAPLIAGGGHFDGIGDFVTGLANGSDPDHPDYWGPTSDYDQRIVESAAIGFAIAMAPQTFWEPLPDRAKRNLAAWLVHSLSQTPAPNNWHFFHVLVSLGLDRAGVDYDRSIIEGDLDYLESLAMDEGWYRDGPGRRAEHYIPFAMHFYGLIHAAISTGHGAQDQERAERFRQRARDFAPQIKLWYAEDGAALPYGRSLTYRFAHAGFWGALALADVEALPWGEIRGYWARNMRYWASLPIADRDGILGVGYGYPNLLMSESYNSPGSPYWAFKAFAPLALPESHPFWQAKEVPYSATEGVTELAQPGMIRWEEAGDVTVLTGGQETFQMRQAAEKYCKFAYSTRYGFSIENDTRTFATGPFDNMLAFSEDGRNALVRESETDARIGADYLYSEWSPMHGVTVESWIIARPPWHLRVHRVTTDRGMDTLEGGFTIRRTDVPPIRSIPVKPPARHADASSQPLDNGRVEVATDEDLSLLIDLSPTARTGRVLQAQPNTNVIFARSWAPQLLTRLEAGTSWLACAVCARPATLGDPGASPAAPTEDELQAMKDAAQPIPVWNI
ncbi:DUF2264 domain-containing protein [Pseudoruegeria sp. HB172150]|uniref:DUF2264 domain-containing protein n=1 Tax=Pseudoruegeria sp. HB172150 TaxID=2721164 RepID=UPI0015571C0A|nr:DUF2264 domain-containing protein [Pseudoruegeria sp. HB172150]